MSGYSPGPALQDMSLITSGGGFTWATPITAAPGGLRATATPVAAAINRVVTVATANDGVALPRAVGGQALTVINAHATNAITVWAANGTSDLISGLASYIVPAAHTAAFFAFPGNWHVLLSA